MTTSHRIPRDTSRIARAEAAAWVSRLHGPERTPAVEEAFRQWLGASPDNAREFEYVTEVWDAAKLVPMGGMPRQGPWPHSSDPRRWALAATVLLACGLAALGIYERVFADRYSAGIGEQRLLRLADGTRILLNSDSRVEVDYDATQRAVRLTRGEAFFEVAQSIQSPFIVFAGTRQVRALGTSFAVRYEDDRTAVTLVEGKVAISSASSTDPDSSSGATILSPGQRLMVTATDPQLSIDEPRIEAVTAWRRGEVILEKTPLAEAIEEMNRYSETKLIASSSAIGALPVSGMYHTGDSEEFARTIALLYGLELVKRSNEIRLTEHRTPQPDPRQF